MILVVFPAWGRISTLKVWSMLMLPVTTIFLERYSDGISMLFSFSRAREKVKESETRWSSRFSHRRISFSHM